MKKIRTDREIGRTNHGRWVRGEDLRNKEHGILKAGRQE